MKLYTDRKRIRAAIQAAQLKATTSVAAFRASVAVPYIRIKAVTGRFVKRLQFVENLSLASLPSLLFGRPLSDSAGVTDLPDVVPNKRPTDIVGAVDLLDPFQIAKGFFENPKIEEGDYFAEDYTVYGYTITSYEMELRKPFSEPLGVADLPDITSDKPLADGVGANAAESIVLKPILGIIDTPAVSDSGSLRMQDYCSFDYFAQDYVGTSLTF